MTTTSFRNRRRNGRGWFASGRHSDVAASRPQGRLRVLPATTERWDDVVVRFGRRGKILVGRALLDGAVAHARNHGGSAGFTEIGRTFPTRPVMRLRL